MRAVGWAGVGVILGFGGLRGFVGNGSKRNSLGLGAFGSVRFGGDGARVDRPSRKIFPQTAFRDGAPSFAQIVAPDIPRLW